MGNEFESAFGTAPAPPSDDFGSAFGSPAPASVASPEPPDEFSAAFADPQRSRTTFERILDTLATGNYASAGAARAAIRGQNPLAGLAQGVHEHTTYGDVLRDDLGVKNPWLAVPAGFALDVALDPTTYLGLGELTHAGQAAKAAAIGEKVAQLSGDAGKVAEAGAKVADAGRYGSDLASRAAAGQWAPISFAGKGILPAPAAQALGKLADTVGAKVGSTEAAQALRKAFLVTPELSGLDRDVFLAKRAEASASAGSEAEAAARALKPHAAALATVAKDHGLDPAALLRSVGDAVEWSKPGLRESPEDAIARSVAEALAPFDSKAAAEAEPHVRDAVSQINGLNAGYLAKEQAAGVGIHELSDPSLAYLYRQMTPEARAALDATGVDPAQMFREFGTGASSQKARSFRGLSTSQINDLARAGNLEVGGVKLPPLPNGVFNEDPFVSTVLRAQQSGRVVGNAELLTQYGNLFAGEKDLVPVTTGLAGKDVVWVPKNMKDVLARQVEHTEEPNYFLRQWDNAQRTWKKYTLGIFPVYHTRNEVGDLWNAVALGGMNPARLGDSIAALAHGTMLDRAQAAAWHGARTEAGEPVFRLGGKSFTATELKDLAARKGVTQGSQVGQLADAIGTVREAPKNLWDAAGRTVSDNAALRVGNAVGQFRENATRLGLFMDRLGRGEGPEAAALYVKKHLFDYGELTDTEKKVLQRVLPFYAFTRFNAPLQMQALFNKPGAFAAVEKARNEAAGASGSRSLGLDNGADLPRFLAEGLPLHAGTSAEGNPQFARLESWLPATDAGLIDPRDVAQKGLSLLSPFIQQPIQAASNVSLFQSDFGSGDLKPVERFPGEQANLLGLPVSKRYVSEPVRAFSRPIAELDRLNPGNLFGTQTEAGLGGLGMVRSNPDTDPVTRMLNLLISRVYAQDPNLALIHDTRSKENQIHSLEGDLRYALSRGDMVNAQRITDAIRGLAAGL